MNSRSLCLFLLTFTLALPFCAGALQVTTMSVPYGVVTRAYSFQLQASGGQTQYIWSIISGALPPGLSLSTNGVISGTPGTNGIFNFTVRVTDAVSAMADSNLSIAIYFPAQITTAPTLPVFVEGVVYCLHLQASGGLAPYNWSEFNGSGNGLPPGLVLNPSGLLSGTPLSSLASYQFTLHITDSASPSQVAQRVCAIFNGTLFVAPFSLPNGTVDGNYNAQLTASGGQAPYTWSVLSGTLPPVLNLSTNGVISGVAQTNGTSNFDALVTDGAGQRASRCLSITINPRPVLSSPRFVSTNQFKFLLTGAAGQIYNIEFSTTLTNWVFLFSTNAVSNSFNIIDSSATNPSRFYRAKVQ